MEAFEAKTLSKRIEGFCFLQIADFRKELSDFYKSIQDHHQRHELRVKINNYIYWFVDILRETYPDYNDFLLYHFLIGSTPWQPCREYDFPFPHSIIECFLPELKKMVEEEIQSLKKP